MRARLAPKPAPAQLEQAAGVRGLEARRGPVGRGPAARPEVLERAARIRVVLAAEPERPAPRVRARPARALRSADRA